MYGDFSCVYNMVIYLLPLVIFTLVHNTVYTHPYNSFLLSGKNTGIVSKILGGGEGAFSEPCFPVVNFKMKGVLQSWAPASSFAST